MRIMELFQITRTSLNRVRWVDSKSKECGCRADGADWTLCQYHSGIEYGVEMAIERITDGTVR